MKTISKAVATGTKIMNVIDIDNNNATRDNVYAIHTNKSIEHVNKQ